jgi:predicted phage tail protein
MKKITLTYEEIELMQFLLNKFGLEEWWISESMWENIDALKLKLTAMRAQMEYIKQRES